MIILSRNEPWPKTWVKRQAFAPEEQIDASFKQVFHKAVHDFMSKNGAQPTHMVLGNTAMDHLRHEVAVPLLETARDDERNETYHGVIVLYSHRVGMEMLWGGR